MSTAEKRYRIAVVCTTSVRDFPPALSLVSNLLELGHQITFLACGSEDDIPGGILNDPSLTFVSLGERDNSVFTRARLLYEVPSKLHRFLDRNESSIDLVWTSTCVDARDVGDRVLRFRHVMQISELVNYVPAFLRRDMPFHSRKTILYAQKARKVVVPEYNRAYIQQAFWRLADTPAVLPNKPGRANSFALADSYQAVMKKFEEEDRRIILYQGIFSDDRDLSPYAKAVDLLDDDYVLYLMGKSLIPSEMEKINALLAEHPKIEYVGYVAAPDHLAFTPYAYIGLLPYVPSYGKSYSPLNAMYCAPNKIWEYAQFGIPMVGSAIPGLETIFAQYDCGLTSYGNPEDIASAILAVAGRHESMSENARIFYESVNPKEIIRNIVNEAMS